MAIKSFKGRLADSSVETVHLATNNGSMGYRIVKFIIFPEQVDNGQISTVQIFSIPQTVASITNDIDFSDQALLGVATHQNNSSSAYPWSGGVFFDNMTFNQDIYITHKDTAGATDSINWYIELEQVKLDLNENTVATLKDIRNIASQ